LPYPEAVFDLDFYRRNPQPFASLAREIWPGFKHKPTVTHSFITLLATKGKLLRNYSQNIDGLEYLAKLPEQYLVECHGHFRSASCVVCQTPADATVVRDSMVQKGQATCCDKCKGWVKPDIVFFGEGLPDRFHSMLQQDKGVADLVLVLGTSLQVAPVSNIPQMVSSRCKRALVNRDLVGVFEHTCRGQVATAATAKAANTDRCRKTTSVDFWHDKRDVFCPGDCDDTIIQLAQLLGWLDELESP
jgi:NAD-dependent SIR2 family protein deacetylase